MPVEVFKNKIRIRVNGILKKKDALLLVQLRSPITNELIWMPPGGGLQFGESIKEGLRREFAEETGLQINIGPFAFLNEVVEPPFHAIECYFKVEKVGGILRLGSDPELKKKDQFLKSVNWVSVDQLQEIKVVPEQLKSWVFGMKDR